MIEKHYLFPECYIAKIPKCDKCKIELRQTGTHLATYPPQLEYECPGCKEISYYREDEVQGEWKWRTI